MRLFSVRSARFPEIRPGGYGPDFSRSARKTADVSIEKNAAAVAEAIYDEENVLIVTTNLYDDFRGFNIDSHLHKPVQMVVMNDMLLNAANEGGKYKSWTPYAQSPNVANEPTVDADTLVFDITTADYVEFTDSVQTQKIGDYVVAKIDPDKPFLKTAIASMDGFTLHPGDPGSLLVFDDAILERGSITLNVVMRSADGSEGTVVFSSGGEKREVSVNADYQSYEITLPVNDGGFFSFQIQPSSDVFIAEYSTT